MQEVGDNMAGIEIGIDDTELEKVYQALKKYPKSAERAMVRLTNEAVTKANSELLTQIPKKYNITKGDLQGGTKYKSEASNNLIKAKKISSLQQQAKVEVRGSMLTLIRFAQENKPNKKGVVSKRVFVKVKKGRKKGFGKTTFIQTDKYGNTQIFQRRSGSRKINRLLKTTSVAHMAAKEEIATSVQEAATKKFESRSQHYIERELKKIKG